MVCQNFIACITKCNSTWLINFEFTKYMVAVISIDFGGYLGRLKKNGKENDIVQKGG